MQMKMNTLMRSCSPGVITLSLGLLTSCAASGAGFGAVSFGAPEIGIAGLDKNAVEPVGTTSFELTAQKPGLG